MPSALFKTLSQNIVVCSSSKWLYSTLLGICIVFINVDFLVCDVVFFVMLRGSSAFTSHF